MFVFWVRGSIPQAAWMTIGLLLWFVWNVGFTKVLRAVLRELRATLEPQARIHPAITGAHVVPKLLCSLQIRRAPELREDERGQRHGQRDGGLGGGGGLIWPHAPASTMRCASLRGMRATSGWIPEITLYFCAGLLFSRSLLTWRGTRGVCVCVEMMRTL